MRHRSPTARVIPIPRILNPRRPVGTLVAIAVAIVALIPVMGAASQAYRPTSASAYSIWPSSTTPKHPSASDRRSVELGVRFTSATPGEVTALRFYKARANTGRHVGTLWSPEGRALATARFNGGSSSGWQQASLSRAVKLEPGKQYTVSYRAPAGRYAADSGTLSPRKTKTTRDLTAVQGVYTYGRGMPRSTYRDSNYYVDIVFRPSGQPGQTGTATSTSTSTAPTTTTSTSSTTTRPTSTTTSSTSTSTSTSSSPSTTSRSSTTTPSSTSTTSRTSTTTPTSSSSSTTPPSTARGCVSRPSSCGLPDATNTGVQSGVSLKSSGCVTARTDGQVIENLVIDGCTISVEAKNVVIRNVKLTHTALETWGIIVREGASATISNVEVAGRDKSTRSVQYAILSQTMNRVTVDRANLHHCADCIQGENMTVTNSYIHDLANPPGAHVDGFQCNSSCGVTLRNNTILVEYTQTAAIALFADFGTPRNSVIEGNLLSGGGYTLYGGESNATGIQVKNNRFARNYYANGGRWGPVTDFYSRNSGNVWSGNIWDDTGAAVSS